MRTGRDGLAGVYRGGRPRGMSAILAARAGRPTGVRARKQLVRSRPDDLADAARVPATIEKAGNCWV